MATKAAPAKKIASTKKLDLPKVVTPAKKSVDPEKKKFVIRIHPCEEWPLATMTIVGESNCNAMLNKLAIEGMTPDPKKRQNLLWDQALKKDGTIHTNHVQILSRCRLLQRLGFTVDWKTSSHLTGHYPTLLKV
jgi:hypothetical protein